MSGEEQPVARLTAYRVSLRRYAALREWTNVGSMPWKRSGGWLRHGIDVYFWNKAEVRS